jgi:hypothetical protein
LIRSRHEKRSVRKRVRRQNAVPHRL